MAPQAQPVVSKTGRPAPEPEMVTIYKGQSVGKTEQSFDITKLEQRVLAARRTDCPRPGLAIMRRDLSILHCGVPFIIAANDTVRIIQPMPGDMWLVNIRSGTTVRLTAAQVEENCDPC